LVQRFENLPVLRPCRNVPCPKVGLQLSACWVGGKLVVILLRMKSSDNFEIPSRSGPQIDHDFEVREVANELLYNARTVSFLLVSEPG